jgi:DNA end-binding protein Ku
MRESGRCALARWSWKAKQYVVQIRAAEDGLVLQQLLYADEVRSLKDLGIEHAEVSKAELALAMQLIDQITQDEYDPTQFKDEEKARVLAAIDQKIAGQQVVASSRDEQPAAGAQVIDLMEALRASLGPRGAKGAAKPAADAPAVKRPAAKALAPAAAEPVLAERKSARRAAPVAEPAAAPAPRARARK